MTSRSAWRGTAVATILVAGSAAALVATAITGLSRQEEAVRESVLAAIRDAARGRGEEAAREAAATLDAALRPISGENVLETLRSTSRRPDVVEEYFLVSLEGDILFPGDLRAAQPQVMAYEDLPGDAAGRRLLAEARLLERAGKRSEALDAFGRLALAPYGRTLRAEALADLAASRFAGREFPEAAATYRRLLTEVPAGFVEPALRVLARFQVAASIEAGGDPAAAEEEYRSMLADALGDAPTLPIVPATRWFVGQALARLRGMAADGKLSAGGRDALAQLERLEEAKLEPGGVIDALRTWVLPGIRRAYASTSDPPSRMSLHAAWDDSGGRPIVAAWRGVFDGRRVLLVGMVARLDRLVGALSLRAAEDQGVEFALEHRGTRLLGHEGEAAIRVPAPWPLDFAEVASIPRSADVVEGPVLRQRVGGRVLLGLALLLLGTGLVATIRGRAQAHRFARLQADFVARVSHDLKTPLALVRLYAETLLRPECDRAKAEEYHRVIARESERLTHMVNNLLDFSRVQDGQRVYDRRPVDLARIVREAAERFRPRLVEEGFALEVEAPEGEVVAAADAEAVAGAVVNLLDNARKYSGDARDVRVRLVAEADHARIEVLDRGIGIPEAERERVFERFHRGSDPRVLAQKGAGLGLALVRHVAEGHGGRAWVEANDGQGTVASIELPR